MPKAEAFEAPAAFYATLLHELAHSTGRVKRLAREEVSHALTHRHPPATR
jgi:antirestriction protein ArdC